LTPDPPPAQGSPASRGELGPQLLDAVAGGSVVALRLFSGTSVPWWRDWILILAAFWVLVAVVRQGAVARLAALAVMLLLSFLYVSAQLPHTLDLLGIRR